jgi:hypothetical protein
LQKTFRQKRRSVMQMVVQFSIAITHELFASRMREPPRQQSNLRWNVLLKDLRFLASVGLAHFVVWRTVRHRYRENAARREEFKLLGGNASVAQPEPQVVRGPR